LSSKGFFDEITVQDFPIRGHQVYLHITRRRWLNEDTGQVVFSWNLVADATGNTGVRVFFKKINRFKANDCNAIASFYGVTVKSTTSIQRLLSDFKSWNQNHMRKIGLFFQKTSVSNINRRNLLV
jgi:hypothetical protein